MGDNSVAPSCINSWSGRLPWITWTSFYPLISCIHMCVNNVDKKSGKLHKNVGFKPRPIIVTIQYKTRPELRPVATLTCAPFGPCGPGGPSGPCNIKLMSLHGQSLGCLLKHLRKKMTIQCHPFPQERHSLLCPPTRPQDTTLDPADIFRGHVSIVRTEQLKGHSHSPCCLCNLCGPANDSNRFKIDVSSLNMHAVWQLCKNKGQIYFLTGGPSLPGVPFSPGSPFKQRPTN